MRQVWITRPGPPDVLQVREAPDPDAAPGQVRVRVQAAGINFADLMARMGLYPDAPKVPCVVGYEVSGTIDQLGEGVNDYHLGERVMAMPLFGGYTDTLAIATDQIFRVPEKMSFEEAAALPVVYVTAYNMMLFTGALRPGSTVLIHSAAGGVGLAAIQIARTRGCTIFGTASASKHDFLRSQGVETTRLPFAESWAIGASIWSSIPSAANRGRSATTSSGHAGASWRSDCRLPPRERSAACSTRPRKSSRSRSSAR